MSHFWSMGLGGAPTLTRPSPGLWLTTSPCLRLVLGVTLDAPALPAMMPTLPAVLLFHGPRTSLTFDGDPEAPAVLTTRRGDTAFPEPTVPKSQAWHLELGCSPIWLYNGLGGLRETGEGGHTSDNIHPCGRCTSVWTDRGWEAALQPSALTLSHGQASGWSLQKTLKGQGSEGPAVKLAARGHWVGVTGLTRRTVPSGLRSSRLPRTGKGFPAAAQLIRGIVSKLNSSSEAMSRIWGIRSRERKDIHPGAAIGTDT